MAPRDGAPQIFWTFPKTWKVETTAGSMPAVRRALEAFAFQVCKGGNDVQVA
jgi:hypothetical protein